MNLRRPHGLAAWLQILLTALALLYAQTVGAAELRGRVVGITDGDTLTLLSVRREEIRIRLSDIDTPERGQPYGDRARQSLADLAFGRDARIEVRDTDRYGRTVGRVFVGAVDVNAELVRRGSAWVFRRYSNDQTLLRLEADARSARRGLWSLPQAQRLPPWEWRAMGRHH